MERCFLWEFYFRSVYFAQFCAHSKRYKCKCSAQATTYENYYRIWLRNAVFVKTFVLSLEADWFSPKPLLQSNRGSINSWWKFGKDLACFQRTTTNYFANVSDLGYQTLFFRENICLPSWHWLIFQKPLLQSHRGSI